MIALYKDTFSKEFKVVSPESIMEAIIGGTWKPYVEYLRSIGKKEYDAEKKKLPCITISGVFKDGTRSKASLDKYSGLVVLDVDKLEESAIKLLKSQLSADEYVRYAFTSPSGKGIKIIVQVNTGPENHLAAFLHLQKTFEDKYLIKVDPSGKDECRLCYVSWDETAIIRSNSKVFEVDVKYGEIITQYSASNWEQHKDVEDNKIKFSVCVKWVERNKTYRDGEKNVYLHALACACNRVGINMDTCIGLIGQSYQTPDLKWHQSVRSAYFLNQGEHGSVKVKDIGSNEFLAPAYIANYTDDVAGNDLMTITAMLYNHKVPNNAIMDIVSKIGRYYDSQGFIDLRRNNLVDMMNQAITVLHQDMAQQSQANTLAWEVAEDIGRELVKQDRSGILPTYFEPMDEALGGGLLPGNFYGIIGYGGTFKSIISQYWCYRHAMNDIPVLYLNAEMSRFQFYERMSLQTLGVNLRYSISKGEINESTIDEYITKLQEHTKGNIFMFNGTNFGKAGVLATLENIYATTGKKIKMIIMDGLTQMDPLGREEAQANIHNSALCKEISKEAYGGEGVALVALIHCSGEENKTLRNTGARVRGATKVLANLDGFFSTSLLLDPLENDGQNEDLVFIPSKMYFRLTDKRSTAGIVSTILNIDKNIHLEYENADPRSYEVNLKQKQPF